MNAAPLTPLTRPGRVAVLAAAAATAALLTACGPANQATGHAAPATGTTTGRAADITITTVSGATVQLPATKATAVLFFAVGCGECNDVAKALVQASHTTGDKAAFLAVDMNPSESASDIDGFLHAAGDPTLPAAIDKDAALSRRYNVAGLSTVIVIDPSGTVTYRASSPPADAITAALDKAGARG